MEKYFIYSHSYNPEEKPLCMLEMRSFFQMEPKEELFSSRKEVAPGRSPFLRERIEVTAKGKTLEDLKPALERIKLEEETFKIICLKQSRETGQERLSYQERRAAERLLGQWIDAEADVHEPDHVYGLAALDGLWYFGLYSRSDSVWLQHMKKPRQYSTALSTRMARAVVNIAVPETEGVSVIDPCCGIGNVLVEALSMGVTIDGSDINPLAVTGARENIAHFGLEGTVKVQPIEEVSSLYDAAIIDLPYNLYTHITEEQQLSILKAARNIAGRCIFVTVRPIDQALAEAGFQIIDRGLAVKSKFSREVLVCI
ncbi:RNA methyltransferase [Bacillus mangrovi]|uniref:RNA methyltransferase n=1 Tax=Metabacillus mangrovi TaxID=1491830 RepID=A0A7X2S157_9BACI|nr:RNA methyltransferase [Metabacillus mangrovi]MTH51919.1 RNA methyltransferase [Metabacillus mangrovi]